MVGLADEESDICDDVNDGVAVDPSFKGLVVEGDDVGMIVLSVSEEEVGVMVF